MSIISLSAGMALTFGALHALEPGHGKTAIITYIASEKRNWKDGLVISVSSAVTHSIAILAIAFISHLFFHHIPVEKNVANINFFLKALSGLLICSVGAWYILTSKKKKTKSSCSCSAHNHSHSVHTHRKKSNNFLTSSLIGMAAGLIPCPTVLIAYLAGISSGSSIAGIENVVLFGLGMCISLMSLVTVCSIFGERVLQRFEHQKISLNWRLCQGVLFIIVGLVTAMYH